MRTRTAALLTPLALLPLLAAACGPATDTIVPRSDAAEPTDASAPARPLRVLLFEKETEWFHPSNPVADRVFHERAAGWGWEVTSTKDAAVFSPDGLKTFDVVFFSLTSGTVLDGPQRDVFHDFIARGGGFAGTHSASHTDYDSPWMIGLVGTTFLGHPLVQTMTMDRVADGDAIVEHVPDRWTRTDEWYSFKPRPEDNPRVQVLLALDESSNPGYPGPDFPQYLKVGYHPITWKLEYGGGRSFYTAMGHTEETYADEAFLEMVRRGVDWAGANRIGR